MTYDLLIVHPTGGWGGAERTTINIIEGLAGSSFKIALATNQPRFQDAVEGKATFVNESFNGWFGSWKNVTEDIKRLARITRGLNPRLVLAMMPYGCFLASSVKFLSGQRYTYIASPRGSALSYLRNFVTNRSSRLRYKIFF